MENISNLISKMQKLTYFARLAPEKITKIIRTGSITEHSEHEMIVEEGQPCAGLFVLLSGEIYLKKIGPEGQYHTLYVLSPVNMFNEVSVLDHEENPASAFTGKDSVIWRIEQDKILNIIEMNPSVAMGLLAMMAKRNRSLLSHYEDISFLTVPGRLAKLLLELSNQGKNIIIRKKHTIAELSERIGTVPEVLCRTIKSFRVQGLIQTSRLEIDIIDADTLSKIAYSD